MSTEYYIVATVIYGCVALALALGAYNLWTAWQGYRETRAINAKVHEIQALHLRVVEIDKLPKGPERDAALKAALVEAERLVYEI